MERVGATHVLANMIDNLGRCNDYVDGSVDFMPLYTGATNFLLDIQDIICAMPFAEDLANTFNETSRRSRRDFVNRTIGSIHIKTIIFAE